MSSAGVACWYEFAQVLHKIHEALRYRETLNLWMETGGNLEKPGKICTFRNQRAPHCFTLAIPSAFYLSGLFFKKSYWNMLCVFFPVDPVSEQALRPLARRIYFHHGSHYLQLNRGALLVDL